MGIGAVRNFDKNQKVSDVQIGQVKAGRGKVILQSKASGSGIVTPIIPNWQSKRCWTSCVSTLRAVEGQSEK